MERYHVEPINGGLKYGGPSDAYYEWGPVKVGTVEILPSDWVLPTGHNDPSDSWMREELAYDGNPATFAESVKLDTSEWSGFLELTFENLIMSNYAEFNASSVPGYNDEIDLDIHRGGVWIDGYQGAFADRVWVGASFTQGSVDKVRIRMRTRSTGGGPQWLYGVQLWSLG